MIHLLSAFFAVIGLIFLITSSIGDNLKLISVTVYGISLVLLFSASAAYHLANPDESRLRRLRKFDHSAIYLLIAGTYTPVCLNFFDGTLRWGFLALVWAIALAGVGVKLFIINAPRWVTAGVYLLMGWMAVWVIKPMLATMPVAAVLWLFAGGVVYSIGAVIYATKKLDLFPGVFGFHEVWHIFVSFGALCHFIMICNYIALA